VVWDVAPCSPGKLSVVNQLASITITYMYAINTQLVLDRRISICNWLSSDSQLQLHG
jgi:hypothetical protein